MPNLTLCLNNTNVVSTNGYTSSLSYNFVNGGLSIPEDSNICLLNATIPYSWFNINAQLYNNNIFQYSFPGANSIMETFTVNVPNGNYAVPDLNLYLQQIFIQNGQYLVDNNGQNYYFMQMDYNTIFYAVQLLIFAVPTVLPTGWTNPNNIALNVTAITPILTISNANFGQIIGYSVGSYPATPQNINQSFLSNITPNASVVNSLLLTCNLVENPAINNSNIIASLPINSVFGSNITYQATFPNFMQCKRGIYQSIQLQIVDQNFNIVPAIDPNMQITLIVSLGTISNK